MCRSTTATGWRRPRRGSAIARALERSQGDLVIATMRKEDRTGKVFIDWSQNSPTKTTVAAYSLRPRRLPTVSTPVTLEEVDACARKGDPEQLQFLAEDVVERARELEICSRYELGLTISGPPCHAVTDAVERRHDGSRQRAPGRGVGRGWMRVGGAKTGPSVPAAHRGAVEAIGITFDQRKHRALLLFDVDGDGGRIRLKRVSNSSPSAGPSPRAP